MRGAWDRHRPDDAGRGPGHRTGRPSHHHDAWCAGGGHGGNRDATTIVHRDSIRGEVRLEAVVDHPVEGEIGAGPLPRPAGDALSQQTGAERVAPAGGEEQNAPPRPVDGEAQQRRNAPEVAQGRGADDSDRPPAFAGGPPGPPNLTPTAEGPDDERGSVVTEGHAEVADAARAATDLDGRGEGARGTRALVDDRSASAHSDEGATARADGQVGDTTVRVPVDCRWQLDRRARAPSAVVGSSPSTLTAMGRNRRATSDYRRGRTRS